MLLSVQAVGPKLALAILSTGTPRELATAIAAGDHRRFTSVPGIGKRTAERVIVELRPKVGVEADGSEPIVVHRSEEPCELARAGLVELGYSGSEAEALLAGVQGDSAEQLIAGALRAARSA